MSACLLYMTAPDDEMAQFLAHNMLLNGLCACINIFSPMRSMYVWEGIIEQAQEVAMLIKTTETLAPSVIAWIAEQHPYDCPCVVQLPITGGHSDFLEWICANTHNSY